MVFGVSDGLVSNVALVLGIAGATTDASLVRLAGLSGLLAGALSMAAGEWVSVTAQNELVERELAIERKSLEENPALEKAELAAIYRSRGLAREDADVVAHHMHLDPEVALDVHAREELGIDPTGLGSAARAAGSSFVAFALGALLPLMPWFFGGGSAAVVITLVIGLVAAASVGGALAHFTERPIWRAVARQVGVAVVACTATFLIGRAVGVNV